ncbi:anti-sigma factor domain-containing protein [Dictyobacter halimunensis]|uniref:anti-sigma factor domain-containing protein n=1 Tax=Dictyobacter halimunensis TaxID=3026934 RepID=UPI003B97DFB3
MAAGIFALWQNKHISSSQPPLTTVASMALPPVNGVASFHDTSRNRSGVNSVSVNVRGLQPLSDGSRYEAWLVNEHELHIQALGTLTKTGDEYVVNFSQPDGNLLSQGNTLQVTVETTRATLPTGRVLLSAHFPPMAGMHINHLLVSYPETPNKVALLPGLLAQTRQLYALSQQLRTTNDKTTVQCLAQNMLVLLDGQDAEKPVVKSYDCSSAHVPPLSSSYGLLGQHNDGYVSTVGAHASLAATQTDSTDTIRKYAQQVIFSSENLSNWFSTLHQDSQYLLAHPDDHDKAVEVMNLADHALNGVDSNDNGSVEPIRGEAGAMQAYLSGQSMATLTLTNK